MQPPLLLAAFVAKIRPPWPHRPERVGILSKAPATTTWDTTQLRLHPQLIR